MKKTLLMATGALMAAGFAADAKAVDVELYGQVNKTLMVTDNGTDSEFAVRDNDKSSTRVGLKGEQMLDNGLTVSVLAEYEMNGDNTRDKSGTEVTSGSTGSNLVERHARVGVAGAFGTVLVGHTSVATDSAAEQDMAGVSDLLGSDIRRFGGNTAFGGSITTGTTVTDTFATFDGDRADVVAYNSPVINGVQARLSTSEGGEVQGAVFYKGKYDAVAVKAALGYESNSTDGIDNTIMGSVSLKHDSGLAATYAYGQEEAESSATAEADMHYFKVGYAFDAFEVAADYATHEADNSGLEGKAFGIGAQYNLGHGVSVAGAYRNLEAEDNAGDADDIDLIMANVRVKF